MLKDREKVMPSNVSTFKVFFYKTQKTRGHFFFFKKYVKDYSIFKVTADRNFKLSN